MDVQENLRAIFLHISKLNRNFAAAASLLMLGRVDVSITLLSLNRSLAADKVIYIINLTKKKVETL